MTDEIDHIKRSYQLLLKNGYDVRDCIKMHNDFMHEYISVNNDEFMDAMSHSKHQTLEWYLKESEDFEEYVKDRITESLDLKCAHYDASRHQLVNELGREQGNKGTQSFRNFGCYDCNGHKSTCESYINLNN